MPIIGSLLQYLYPPYDACFALYKHNNLKLAYRVGCCEWTKRRELDLELEKIDCKVIDRAEGQIQNRELATITMQGNCEISGNESELQLM